MEALEKIWHNLWTPLSWPFTVIILIMLGVDLVSHYWDQGKKHKQLTGIMTGTGILGTFFGVVVGLQDFDPRNIGASIGPLLDGLKVSFATSVAGIFASISTETVETLFPSKRGKTGDPVADALSNSLIDLNELLADSKKANISVADNMALMRTEMRDESSKVRKALEDALAALAQGASKEIIAALERVITDFNNNLKEQFGENFRQLNEACLKMVEWQKTYREAVETANSAIVESGNALNQAREQMEAAVPQKEAFYQIVKDTGTSIQTMASLNDRLETLTGVHEETLKGFSTALTDVRERAVEMENQIKLSVGNVAREQLVVVTGFSDLALEANQSRSRIEEMLTEHARGHKAVADHIDEVISKLGNGSKELEGHLDKALSELENNLASLTRSFGVAYNQYLDAMRKLTTRSD